MELDARMLLTLGGMLISIVSAAAIVRTKLQAVIDQLADIEGRIRALDKISDQQEIVISQHTQSLSTITDMLAPAEREKRAIAMASLNERVSYIADEVERLRHQHNGSHPPVASERKAT